MPAPQRSMVVAMPAVKITATPDQAAAAPAATQATPPMTKPNTHPHSHQEDEQGQRRRQEDQGDGNGGGADGQQNLPKRTKAAAGALGRGLSSLPDRWPRRASMIRTASSAGEAQLVHHPCLPLRTGLVKVGAVVVQHPPQLIRRNPAGEQGLQLARYSSRVMGTHPFLSFWTQDSTAFLTAGSKED